jgi:hypothetical protein
MTNWTEAEYPIAPWDPPGLPPRVMADRCAHHTHCAYRDDDPDRCPHCHRPWSQPSYGCARGLDARTPRRDCGRLHPVTPPAASSGRPQKPGSDRRRVTNSARPAS